MLIEVGILTLRERQVFQLVTCGLTNKQIALELGISVRTVHGYVRQSILKMGLVGYIETK